MKRVIIKGILLILKDFLQGFTWAVPHLQLFLSNS